MVMASACLIQMTHPPRLPGCATEMTTRSIAVDINLTDRLRGPAAMSPQPRHPVVG